jgi:leucyl aminopeptidase
MVEGFILGEYEFDRYKSIKASNPIESIMISTECYTQPTEPLDVEKLSKDLSDALIVAESVNLARDIVNTPPDDMTPLDFASFADEIADAENLDCIIHDERYLEQEKMGAFLAVGRASAHKPRLIHLIYAPKNPIATVALVGKGLCYDSGGLSLKPAEHMVTMKADKSGAAAVLAVMSALDRLGFPIEVHGVIGAAENMIGGNAYKPDDVLTAKNGKTIEIRNTDAEGRLVLADCLCYIQDYLAENNKKPNYILDFATLTGACVVALGEYTTGVMGHSDEAKERVLKAAKSSGELASTLPFNRYLSELMKSEIADLSNISSSRYGGAITAAIFLSNFISEENKEAWVHLDIAGPAYVEKSWGYNPHGASGAGVRLALKWLAHLSK